MLTPQQKREAQAKAERVAQRTRDLIGCEILPPKLKCLCAAQSHMQTSERAVARGKALDNLLIEKADALLQAFRDKIVGDGM
jgi:hypothetical protein